MSEAEQQESSNGISKFDVPEIELIIKKENIETNTVQTTTTTTATTTATVESEDDIDDVTIKSESDLLELASSMSMSTSASADVDIGDIGDIGDGEIESVIPPIEVDHFELSNTSLLQRSPLATLTSSIKFEASFEHMDFAKIVADACRDLFNDPDVVKRELDQQTEVFRNVLNTNEANELTSTTTTTATTASITSPSTPTPLSSPLSTAASTYLLSSPSSTLAASALLLLSTAKHQYPTNHMDCASNKTNDDDDVVDDNNISEDDDDDDDDSDTLPVRCSVTKPVDELHMQQAIDSIIDDGLSIRQAADKYQVNKSTLWRRLSKLPERPMRPRNTQLAIIIESQLRDGRPLSQIARSLNVAKSTVHQHKMRLIKNGRLPSKAATAKMWNSKESIQVRLEQAFRGHRDNCMTVRFAAQFFNLPLTTLWRYIRRKKGAIASAAAAAAASATRTTNENVVNDEDDNVDEDEENFYDSNDEFNADAADAIDVREEEADDDNTENIKPIEVSISGHRKTVTDDLCIQNSADDAKQA